MDFPLAKTVDKAMEKPATTVGNVINGIMLAIFSPLVKYNVRKEVEIENYKQQILIEVSKIPEEKLVEPPLNIIGPALEASKFYIEDDELKAMFAKLIASSMNEDTAKKAHPSFIEIIKQLSPLDAQNLKLFALQGVRPIATYRIVDQSKNGVDLKTCVFLSNSNCSDLDLIAGSLTNLSRLGLLEITYQNFLVEESLYQPFEETPFYANTKAILSIKDVAQRQELISKFVTVDLTKYSDIDIEKGLVKTTPLGKIFIGVCLSKIA